MLQLSVLEVKHNEALIVVNTLPGLADFIGDIIDRANLNILGCVSGENTVFITPASTKEIKKVYISVKSALHKK